MKTSYLVNRSARVILGFIVLLGIGFVSSANGQRSRNWDGYPNWGGSFDLRQTALNAGYNEGTKEGRNDRARNRHANFQDFSAYQKATKDYSSRLGDRELYRRYFRKAFESGYNTELGIQDYQGRDNRDFNRYPNRNDNYNDNRSQDRRGRNWDRYGSYGGSFDLRQTALNAGYNEGIKE